MTGENPSDAVFLKRLQAFAWAAGNTGLLLMLTVVLAWLFYVLQASGTLAGLPLWLIPGAERLLTWVIVLKMLAVLAMSGWLLATFWHRRLSA